MDLITLAKAKKYTDSQRLGYAEELTFDGNIEGKQYYEELALVKVSETAYDLSEATSITLHEVAINKFTLPNPDIALITEAGAQFLAVADGQDIPLVVSIQKDFAVAMDLGISGTWFLYNLEGFYCAGIEILHPIDPKYLPGVCLPVVEISTALNLESPVTLTEAESTALDGAMALETPVIAKCINVIDGCGMAVVCTNFGGALLTGFYGGGQLSSIYVSFSKDEDNGLWVVTTTLA